MLETKLLRGLVLSLADNAGYGDKTLKMSVKQRNSQANVRFTTPLLAEHFMSLRAGAHLLNCDSKMAVSHSH